MRVAGVSVGAGAGAVLGVVRRCARQPFDLPSVPSCCHTDDDINDDDEATKTTMARP